MREKLARAVAILAVIGLGGVSVLFAEVQNRPQTTESRADHTHASGPQGGQEAPPVDTVRARTLFAELGCGGCHSVEDLGNPRNPLDGIGTRRSPASIRTWTLGEAAVADSLSPAVLRIKGTFADVPEVDLETLVSWLAGLRRPPP